MFSFIIYIRRPDTNSTIRYCKNTKYHAISQTFREKSSIIKTYFIYHYSRAPKHGNLLEQIV